MIVMYIHMVCACMCLTFHAVFVYLTMILTSWRYDNQEDPFLMGNMLFWWMCCTSELQSCIVFPGVSYILD